jgi:hypothetical protein
MADMSAEMRLDPVVRLRVLAAALPGSTLVTREIGAPLASVWAVVEDLERYSPLYEPSIASAAGEERGDRKILHMTYKNGLREDCVVRLAAGWCLMQSPSVVVAFAARSTKTGTLLAHLEHWRSPGQASFAASKLEGELLEIERLAQSLS